MSLAPHSRDSPFHPDNLPKPTAIRILEGINQAGIPRMIGTALRGRSSGDQTSPQAQTRARSVTGTRNSFRDRMRQVRTRTATRSRR